MSERLFIMNETTSFAPAPDGWFHIAPHGTFPHPTGALQVIDAEACEAMLATFREESRQPNFPGLLVDFDHASHDPARPTTAAGWIGALEHRGDGLYAQIRWSDLGQQALTGGRYRLASPVWNRADCDQWMAAGSDGREVAHLRPRRLDRLALTNDPNLPGLAPLSNRLIHSAAVEDRRPLVNETYSPMNLRNEILQHLQLPASTTDAEIAEAIRHQASELESLRNRCQRLAEVQAENDLERFAEVITNRDVVRAQLLANREATLALLNALRHPEPAAPLHQPHLYRPNLHLLSPLAPEPQSAAARKIANRARQLQSQLKIGHHAAFRMAEGEAETEVA
ncbi:MAG: phage protease [Methylacidiphilales bacterium]|nr:phage protease [Candidatus Methylacidiphilales bacterium]